MFGQVVDNVDQDQAGLTLDPGAVPLSVLDLAPGARRRDRARGAAGHHRPGPARRAPGLPAVLGGRAPQHARHRQLGAGRADRPHRRRDRHDPGGLGRRHAAEPCPAGRRRAVRHARGAPSGAHRSGHRPGAGHRPGHRRRAAPLAGGAVGRRLPRPAHGPAGLLHRPLAGRPPVRPDHRRARAGATSRPCGCSAPAATAPRWPGCSACPFAFAHHFSPANTLPALALYRSHFRPPTVLDQPYAMVAAAVVCADTDERARWLAGSGALSFLRLRSGRPGPMPSPEEAAAYPYTDLERAFIEDRPGHPDHRRPRHRPPRPDRPARARPPPTS